MMLIWDGLQVQIPETMQPATLDRGFVRFVGPELPTVSLRFGAEKRPFDAQRDGRRLLQAAGMPKEPLQRCKETWTIGLPGDLYCSSRMYVLQLRNSQGIVAALFSALPAEEMVEELFTSLAWTPPDTWRRWYCYDMMFETPPEYLLSQAVFQPGRFQLKFSKGRSLLHFDRLAPANVLLGAMSLAAFCKQHLQKEVGHELTITPRGDAEADLHREPPRISRILPWLPGLGRPLRGKIRHLAGSNKIFILTEQGLPLPEAIANRLHASYANIPLVKVKS